MRASPSAFVGVHDQDEAERIVERDITPEADHLPMTSRTEAVKAKLRSARRAGPSIRPQARSSISKTNLCARSSKEPPTLIWSATYAEVANKLQKATNEYRLPRRPT